MQTQKFGKIDQIYLRCW